MTLTARTVEFKQVEEGRQSNAGEYNLTEKKHRRDDWQDTVAHAEGLTHALEDALKRLRHIERWY